MYILRYRFSYLESVGKTTGMILEQSLVYYHRGTVMGQVPVSAGTGTKVINAVLTTSEEPKKENQLFFLRSSKKLKSQQNDTSKIEERVEYRE